MPELPEVETTVRGLKKTITNLTIKEVWTDLSTKDKRQNETIANQKYFKFFKKEILGKKILSVKRRAKNILINLSGKKTILIHMKMTGHLLYGEFVQHSVLNKWLPVNKGPLNDPYNRFVHSVFSLSNKKILAFSDARKFGKIVVLDTGTAKKSKHLNTLGPEPLDSSFNLKKFKERLERKPDGKIKTILLDQSIIAGIGNIYSDEILWRSGVHPERRVSKLKTIGKNNEIKLMFRAIKKTLSKGIAFGGDSISDYRNIHGLPGKFQLHHKVYRRTGEKCRKSSCRGIIERKVVNGRSAHFCSVHQK